MDRITITRVLFSREAMINCYGTVLSLKDLLLMNVKSIKRCHCVEYVGGTLTEQWLVVSLGISFRISLTLHVYTRQLISFV